MTRTFDRREFDELVASLTQPGAAAELGVLAVCLLAAWLVVRLLQGRRSPDGSILFGDRVVDDAPRVDATVAAQAPLHVPAHELHGAKATPPWRAAPRCNGDTGRSAS